MEIPMEYKASFCCCTYRRPERVEEMLQCFLDQTYPNKELIIFNDEPSQQLAFDHPQVTIVNWPKKITSLGRKRNMAISLCKGELVFPVDDDDLYSPEKIETSIRHLSPGGVFKTDMLYIDTDPMQIVIGRMHCNYAFTKGAFIAAGGYQMENIYGGDIRLMKLLDMNMDVFGDACDPITKPLYLYRAFTTDHHVSNPSAIPYPKDRDVPAGRIELTPRKIMDFDSIRAENTRARIADILKGPVRADLGQFYKGIRS